MYVRWVVTIRGWLGGGDSARRTTRTSDPDRRRCRGNRGGWRRRKGLQCRWQRWCSLVWYRASKRRRFLWWPPPWSWASPWRHRPQHRRTADLGGKTRTWPPWTTWPPPLVNNNYLCSQVWNQVGKGRREGTCDVSVGVMMLMFKKALWLWHSCTLLTVWHVSLSEGGFVVSL